MRFPLRRLTTLGALTAFAVATGSIAVADGTSAGDVAARALDTTPEVAPVDPTTIDPAAAAAVSAVPTVRTPPTVARAEELAVEPVVTQSMVASWYGPNFHGRLTANGETFDQWALTAAHKSLPFGTRLEVTNPGTGRSVVVRVNDRGPFTPGRDIDLSRAAAEALGIGGVSRVEVAFV